MWFGLVGALFSAVCHGVAAAMQAVAARATRDDRHGVDPRLIYRLFGQSLYVISLVLNVVGLAAQIVALRSLPLFVVQAAQAASIAVTAPIAVRWFGVRMSRSEWGAVAAVCAGLSMLGVSAAGEGTGHATHSFRLWLLVGAVLLVVAGMGAGQLPNTLRTPLLGLISGLEFGAMGLAIRVIPARHGVHGMLADPAPYTVVVAGVAAAWFYAAALQRGGVVAATAMMLVAETLPPSVIGVLVLGDGARHGWAPVAVVGFFVAVCGALALARFGELEAHGRTEPEPAEALRG